MTDLTLHMELTDEAYSVLKRDGILLNAPDLIGDHDWLPAYEWLTLKMLERLPAPSSDWKPWPLWAWLRIDGKDKGFRISEPGNWMLKFRKPANQVLLTDYMKWHSPLNLSWLTDYAADEAAADREYDEFQELLAKAGLIGVHELIEKSKHENNHQHLLDTLHRSWDRVFDVENAGTVQATFWQLDLQDVISARQKK